MITIYGFGGARSRRVIWACEEIGAPYEVKVTAMPVREKHPEFLELSPAGALPAMVDGDVTMIESLAICEYVVRKHGGGLILGPDDKGYTDYLQYLAFGEGTLAPPLTWTRRFGPELEKPIAMGREAFVQRQAVLSHALKDGRPWLAGETFTLADISVGYVLGLAQLFGVGDLIVPDVAAYHERLKARPAYQRAYAV